jgi:hypothetical protein
MIQKMTVFKLCAARDLTAVDGGLQFTASKNLQDKHNCSSENIANLACLWNGRRLLYRCPAT